VSFVADSFAFPWARDYDAARLGSFVEDLWGAASGDNSLATLDAIEKVVASHRPEVVDGPQLDDSVIQTIAQKVVAEVFLAAKGGASTPCPLTKRELECLVEVARGASYEGAASALGLSRQTVSTHLRHVYQTLHAGTAARAVAVAVHHGWISAPDLRLLAPVQPAEHRTSRDWALIYRECSAALRSSPGEWLHVAFYSSAVNASRAVRNIRDGKYVEFRPPGIFEAEVCRSDQGQWPVRARLLGAEPGISGPGADGEVR
jgi:DNA-binding CsgD family transcriptional regulator